MKPPLSVWFLSPLLIAAVLIAACSNQSLWDEVQATVTEKHPSVVHITTDSLATWLADPTLPAPILLDVRSPEEHAVSHLYGAYRIDPADERFGFLENISAASPIVTYCSVGQRSAAVAERLIEQGYTNVYNLEGSLFQWANEGHAVYRDDEEVSEVHPGDDRWRRLLDRELRSTRVD